MTTKNKYCQCIQPHVTSSSGRGVCTICGLVFIAHKNKMIPRKGTIKPTEYK